MKFFHCLKKKKKKSRAKDSLYDSMHTNTEGEEKKKRGKNKVLKYLLKRSKKNVCTSVYLCVHRWVEINVSFAFMRVCVCMRECNEHATGVFFLFHLFVTRFRLYVSRFIYVRSVYSCCVMFFVLFFFSFVGMVRLVQYV